MPGPDLAGYLLGWLDSRRALRPSTELAYEIHLRRHILPRLGHLPLQELTPSHVDGLYADLLAGRTAAGRLSASTVRRIHATLMSALNQAVRRGLIASNPAALVELPRAWPVATASWTPEQAAAFLRGIEGDRLAALFTVLLVAGVRRGEALGLRWDDLDLVRAEMRVEQQLVAVAGTTHLGPPKSSHGRRTLALSPELLDVLRRHRTRQQHEAAAAGATWHHGGLVFTDLWGQALVPGAVSRRFRQLLQHTGLPAIRLHDLRHTSASIGLASGETLFEVSRRLGHSSIAITADTYSHVVPAVAQESANRLARGILRRT